MKEKPKLQQSSQKDAQTNRQQIYKPQSIKTYEEQPQKNTKN